MKVDGLDGEEIEEDELEADAGEDFGGEEVGDPEFEEEFRDNRTGKYLDPELVAKARSEEVEFMAKIGLHQEVDITECLQMTRRPPISTRWVDVNKGSTESPDVRCRLVARDFKPKGEKDRSDIFAAMPPLEAKKLLFRKAVGGRKELRNGEWCQQKIMLIDVKKSHFCGELEDHELAFVFAAGRGECEQGKCWRLRRWLYGMRPAASAWEKHYSKTLVDMGFAKGGDSRDCILRQGSRRSSGSSWRALGCSRTPTGWRSPRSRRRWKMWATPHWNEELDPDDARLFSALAVRGNYISQDRADVQYAAKEACRHMAAPTRAAWGKLIRWVRYLLQFPRLAWTFKRDECETDTIDVFSDSDWAGCVRTRRSTSGGRRHRRRIGNKALELDAGDGGPLEWRGGVSGLGKGRLRGNRHPGICP